MTSENWLQYVRGYEGNSEADKDAADKAINDMIEGWDAFKSEVGQEEALRVFHEWMRGRPEARYGYCDPDGN